MEPIDFPDKYENLMRLAQQALADHQYLQAKTFLQRALELKGTFEANRLLVLCLVELDEKKEALNQAFPYENDYLTDEKVAAFYFDLLIQTKDYLYARKLIASYDFSDLFEQLMVEKIQQAENFTSQNDRQKIRKIHLSVEKMPTMPPAEQLLVVFEIEELPYHELVQTIKKMIILPEIHLLVRAKMLESLVQVKKHQPVVYLTMDQTFIEVIPATLPKPEKQKAYEQLMRLAEAYEDQDAYLSTVLKEEFMMQSALLYPVYDTYVGDPQKWFADTLSMYDPNYNNRQTEAEEADFLEKRGNILREMLLFQSDR
ncbi:hypothetical protein EAC61_RS07680 [Enterococcus hirae]